MNQGNDFRSEAGAVHGGAALGSILLALLGLSGIGTARQVHGHRQPVAPVQESAPLVRYHFDQPVELRQDPHRIAIRAPAGMDAELPPLFAADGVEPMAAPGWYLLRLEVPVEGDGLRALLDEPSLAAHFEFASPVFVDDLGGPLVPTRDLLVRFAPEVGATRAEAVLTTAKAGRILERDWGGLPGAYRLRATGTNGLDVLEAANALARRSDVLWAEPDFLFTGRAEQAPPSDPALVRSWALYGTPIIDYCYGVDHDMGAVEAWEITRGDPNVRVAVLDCGVDSLHPDLNLDPGADFTGQGGGGDPVAPCDHHGTLVAGCISMTADNGLGSVGIAPDCKVVSARIWIMMDTCNNVFSTASSWNVDALQWVVDNGIRVTNLSGHYGFTSSAIEDMLVATRQQGVVHFAAAGNTGTSPVNYPARLPSMVAVGSSTIVGTVVQSSSYGPELDFVAPGSSIFTTDRSGSAGWSSGDYLFSGGTSLASPFAAGIAALLLSDDPTLGPDELVNRLRDSALDIESPGWDERSGWGIVRAGRALTLPKRIRHVPSLDGSPLHLEPRNSCDRPAMSDDGRFVAFLSSSTRLVPGDTNGVVDVFLRDLLTSVVTRVSVDSSGNQADGGSRYPSISGDGRYVAFESGATNLVPGDTNGTRDVFVHDTQTGVTTRVSEGTGGVQGDANSYKSDLSADGRFVAFESVAGNFDPAANGKNQIYVHDRLLGTTTLASKDSGGVAASSNCYFPTVSDDGSRVAFESPSTNLVSGATGAWGIFVCDLGTSTCFLASRDSSGLQARNSWRPTLSGDGQRVSFWTLGDLVPSDTNGVYDAYVRDLPTATTLAASTDASGLFGSRDSFGMRLSADGRYVVLLTASPLVAGDTNEHVDAFRKDLLTGAVVRVSVGTGGAQAQGGSTHPWISADGSKVGFVCDDDELTPGDAGDGYCDVYVHDVDTGVTVLATAGS